MDKEKLNDFTASNGWLENWKKTYGVREKRLYGETDDVSTATIETWIKRLPELCEEYEPQNKLNLDELGLFFKAFAEKGSAEKKKAN